MSSYPHPEDSSGAAKAYGRRNTGNVSRSYSGSGGYHQSLKRRKTVFVIFGFHYDADRLTQHAKLYETCLESKVDPCTKKQDNQNVAVQKIAQSVDDLCNMFKPLFPVVLDSIIGHFGRKYALPLKWPCLYIIIERSGVCPAKPGNFLVTIHSHPTYMRTRRAYALQFRLLTGLRLLMWVG